MVETYRQRKNEVLVGKLYIVWVVGEDGYRELVEWYGQGKMKYWEKNIILCWL